MNWPWSLGADLWAGSCRRRQKMHRSDAERVGGWESRERVERGHRRSGFGSSTCSASTDLRADDDRTCPLSCTPCTTRCVPPLALAVPARLSLSARSSVPSSLCRLLRRREGRRLLGSRSSGGSTSSRGEFGGFLGAEVVEERSGSEPFLVDCEERSELPILQRASTKTYLLARPPSRALAQRARLGTLRSRGLTTREGQLAFRS